jgi:hypothetical protein
MFQQSQSSSSTGLGLLQSIVADIYNQEVHAEWRCHRAEFGSGQFLLQLCSVAGVSVVVARPLWALALCMCHCGQWHGGISKAVSTSAKLGMLSDS